METEKDEEMAKLDVRDIERADERALGRIAHVTGRQGPAQRTLDELKARRDAGETVAAYWITTVSETALIVSEPLERKHDLALALVKQKQHEAANAA